MLAGLVDPVYPFDRLRWRRHPVEAREDAAGIKIQPPRSRAYCQPANRRPDAPPASSAGVGAGIKRHPPASIAGVLDGHRDPAPVEGTEDAQDSAARDTVVVGGR